MKNTSEIKYVREIETDSRSFVARKPFKIENENRRRFIRLEIASPMTISKIKDTDGGFWPDGEWHTINGMILNVSAGGVLVEADQALIKGDILSMHFTLQDVEQVDGVIGMVKRVDQDGQSFLAGIQFVPKEKLEDIFSQAQIDLLPDSVKDFSEGLQEVLNKYISEDRSDKEQY